MAETVKRTHSRPLKKISKRKVCASCQKAAAILRYTHDASQSLLSAYELARTVRGKPRGISKEAEHDLLRAMLVMAGAGLDALTKQLIQDVLPILIDADGETERGLEKFVERRYLSGTDSPALATPHKSLARVLVCKVPRTALIEEYVSDLTGPSLQSPDHLARAVSALGVEPASIGIGRDLKPIFDARNKIVHELDVDFTAKPRKRVPHARAEMVAFTDNLISIAQALLQAVEPRVRAASQRL